MLGCYSCCVDYIDELIRWRLNFLRIVSTPYYLRFDPKYVTNPESFNLKGSFDLSFWSFASSSGSLNFMSLSVITR